MTIDLTNLRAITADVRYRMDGESANAVEAAAEEIERMRDETENCKAQIRHLRAALLQIHDRHLGDCPASMDETEHAKNHIYELRKIAAAALEE